jgi:peptidoglycan/xylan/chitin deacetylase (PgdA/CDA1 family)
VKATYYISLGKVGQDSNVGRICEIEDIKNLIEEGHEIGNHTFDHVNMNHSSIDYFEKSILKNNEVYQELFSQNSFRTLSYPYGVGKRNTIKVAKKYFRCARTTNQGINYGKVCLFMLKATPVYGNGRNFEKIKQLIHKNIEKRGWLNLYTHDINENPSEFGCTPEYFKKVIEYSVKSGSKIATLDDVCDIIGIPLPEKFKSRIS